MSPFNQPKGIVAYSDMKVMLNFLIRTYPRPRSRTSQDRPPFSSENLIRAPAGMSR